MKKPTFVPAETVQNQARASDPLNSAWVSAHAGSGKTHVLSQRVVRLLLGGADPSRILCLTYTKAAAANMAKRVFRDLGRWATLDEASLAEEIGAIEGRQPDRAELALARRLFARALETPGGLKIQTIHAFCEAVLHRFPLEANIAGHFEMLDNQMEQALVAEARRDLLSGASAGQDGALAEAFAFVLQAGGEAGLDALLAEIVGRRDSLRAFIDHLGGAPSGFGELFEEFGFTGEETEEEVARAAWPDGFFTADLARRIQERAAASGKVNAQNFAAQLTTACSSADPVAGLIAARDVFLKAKRAGEWEAKSHRNIMARGVGEFFPEFADEHARISEALSTVCDRLSTFRMLNATRSALMIADWLIARYERLKSARGFLDFNDLITRTVRLLSRQDVGPWIQYKLDQGIDHILVDEAQDTSPDQWRVVAGLTEEFFSGAGARDIHRTVFAVGDEKQSIYSFQGAEPEAFDRHGRLFSEKVRGADAGFERVRLTHSFRSTEDVLSAVDLVFSSEEARQGLTHDPEPLEHKAIRAGEPGLVELWDQIEPEQVEEPDDWTQSIDHASAPAVRLAEIVAGTIQAWLRDGERIDGRGRRIRPGDVLVLVRKRDRFIHALSRGLKNRHIPVAGADRLNLRTHIAVQDLIALGRFVLQPHDDLSLAALLKSPVFGCSEDDLFGIAWNRQPKASLWDALRARAEEGGNWNAVASQFERWRAEADTKPVFEFYAAILGRDGVRRKMIRRLGHEAGEILDEFQNFCLAAEKTGVTDLETFLSTLENAGPDIKREMDQTRDEVRIMTVHASKGLEAPVVFLVDAGSAPFSDSHLPRLLPFRSKKGLWPGSGYVWRCSSDVANKASRAISDAIGEKAKEEYRRLLYVGMTRAEDRLIVCGYRGVRQPDPGIWHSLVENGFAHTPVEQSRHPLAELQVRRFRVTAPSAASPDEEQDRREPTSETLPWALSQPLPQPHALPRPLAPSGASALISDDEEIAPSTASPVLDATAAPSFAIERGTAIHRLLQSLPGMAPGEREAAALRYLERAGKAWPQAERLAAWQSVARVLDDPGFAPVFSPGSRAEVGLMGTLDVAGRPRAVSGKIDRLAVTDEEILIVDYKTNRPPPRTLETVPDAYVAQLAIYRALLAPLYPGRRVTAALLFTEGPHLLALPDDVLDRTLVRLTGA